jgi:hypothetical protein
MVCDPGYSLIWLITEWKCFKHNKPLKTPTTETFGPITFTYDKSNDPLKCHRPTASSLSVPSWAVDNYNHNNSEWKNSTRVTPDGYYYDGVMCHPKVGVCTDREALNYGGEDGVFDEEKEQSNNEICTYEQKPPVDVCPNMEGDQEVVPDGYHTDEQGNCVINEEKREDPCAPGVPFIGSHCGWSPEPEKHNSDAPQCTDGSTTQLPANIHVVRDGKKATVNFFITEGDRANVYYRVVGQKEWQHAVASLLPNADNFVSYTIEGLNPNLGYDFGIQQVRGCGGGNLVTAVVVDGPNAQVFGLSYWEWSK